MGCAARRAASLATPARAAAPRLRASGGGDPVPSSSSTRTSPRPADLLDLQDCCCNPPLIAGTRHGPQPLAIHHFPPCTNNSQKQQANPTQLTEKKNVTAVPARPPDQPTNLPSSPHLCLQVLEPAQHLLVGQAVQRPRQPRHAGRKGQVGVGEGAAHQVRGVGRHVAALRPGGEAGWWRCGGWRRQATRSGAGGGPGWGAGGWG